MTLSSPLKLPRSHKKFNCYYYSRLNICLTATYGQWFSIFAKENKQAEGLFKMHIPWLQPRPTGLDLRHFSFLRSTDVLQRLKTTVFSQNCRSTTHQNLLGSQMNQLSRTETWEPTFFESSLSAYDAQLETLPWKRCYPLSQATSAVASLLNNSRSYKGIPLRIWHGSNYCLGI